MTPHSLAVPLTSKPSLALPRRAAVPAEALAMPMPIAVINLPSRPERWHDAQARFASIGLQPMRLDAIDGLTLGPQAVGALYSERLNRRQYHKALRPGEIGCYASHLAAWRWLVSSGAAAMAIFEDDVELDGDVPVVLEALASAPTGCDIVKLIGRTREKIRKRWPLCGARDLVDYARVPSLTGAYVITALGARKLLAGRPPFGRPVDVDLRHWWECELRVAGVYPYPARCALSSCASTIGERRERSTLHSRLARLRQQAHYSFHNWRELRARGDLLPPHTPAGPEKAASPTVVSVQTRHNLERQTRPRNLVVLRAGDHSLHREWLSGRSRDFDLFISYYGNTPGRHREDADYYEARPGPKWPGIAGLLADHPDLLERYEAFWFPDDDLSANSETLDRMFAFFCAYRLCLAQPALTRDSYFTWNTLLQDRHCHIRYAGFVEVMAPIFSREALRLCSPTFHESRSGWGLDWVWPTLCGQAGLGRLAILDATPVRHTRPVGGELYRKHPEMDPRADAARVLQAYGIDEVRAVAKYSFGGEVRDVSLPIAARLTYWFKRLNGRRKHRAVA